MEVTCRLEMFFSQFLTPLATLVHGEPICCGDKQLRGKFGSHFERKFDLDKNLLHVSSLVYAFTLGTEITQIQS